MSNIADIAAKLAVYWGNLAGAASGQNLQTQGVGRPLTFNPAGAGASEVYAQLYFDQTIGLVIASIGVPVPVGGAAGDSIAHGEVSNCTVNGTLVTITYTGNIPRLCNISALLSSTPLAGSPLQQFHLEVDNGSGFVEVDASEIQAGGAGRKHFSVEITMTLNPTAVVRLTGKRLVNWDPVTMTALADDEVEAEEIDGDFWYLRYPLARPVEWGGQRGQRVGWGGLRIGVAV